jgi:hypothetical protein
MSRILIYPNAVSHLENNRQYASSIQRAVSRTVNILKATPRDQQSQRLELLIDESDVCVAMWTNPPYPTVEHHLIFKGQRIISQMTNAGWLDKVNLAAFICPDLISAIGVLVSCGDGAWKD